MNTEALKAWILHKFEIGETSAQVVFFTREHGVIKVICKGGWKPRTQAVLQAFTPLWVTFQRNYVQHIEMLATSHSFTKKALFAATYVNELIYLGLPQSEPLPVLYTAYENTLQSLVQIDDTLSIERVLRRFERVFLTEIGYHISLQYSDYATQAIKATSYYQFVPGTGFVLSADGFWGANIMQWDSDDLAQLAVLKTAKAVMRRAIAHALDGREIRSRLLYEDPNK